MSDRKPQPWQPRQELDAFKIFLLIEFWLFLLGLLIAFFWLWWGLGIMIAAVVILTIAIAVGGF